MLSPDLAADAAGNHESISSSSVRRLVCSSAAAAPGGPCAEPLPQKAVTWR